MLRSGDVYVGVSAQAVGINAIKAANPTRYGALDSPADSYSYDIFSQGGMALRALTRQILPGLHPRSSSTQLHRGRGVTVGQPHDHLCGRRRAATHVYDGYLIHSRGAAGAAISQAPQPAIASPSVVETRTDQAAPVLTFETETDVVSKCTVPFNTGEEKHRAFVRNWDRSVARDLRAGYLLSRDAATLQDVASTRG
jgi:Alpha/beta hydrolase domain